MSHAKAPAAYSLRLRGGPAMSNRMSDEALGEPREAVARDMVAEQIREQAARPNGLGVALTPAGRAALAELRAKFERQRVAAEESMREIQSQGYAWEPAPSPPERQQCACGQELRTPRAQGRRICGDCFSQFRRGQQGITASPSLDARIAAAKSADLDPTSEWGAGATPGYDWEGR